MKRLAGVVLALIVGTMAVPSVATGAPGVGTAVDQMAEAYWIVMHNRTEGTIYFGLAWRTVTRSGPLTLGTVGKGTCQAQRTRNFKLIVCEGSGRAKQLGVDQFEFDPLLRNASMTFEMKGRENSVTWRGRGAVPQFSGEAFGGDGYVGAGMGMARWARAKAHILGRKMPETGGGMSFAYLMQGAAAVATTDYGRSLILHPDGSFDYRVELRVPR